MVRKRVRTILVIVVCVAVLVGVVFAIGLKRVGWCDDTPDATTTACHEELRWSLP